MVKMVTMEVNPAFKATSKYDAAVFETVKADFAKRAPDQVRASYVTAIENVRRSGGMLRIATEETLVTPMATRALEDMDIDELKLAAVTSGVKPAKGMTKADVISAIRAKMAEFEIEE